MSDLVVTVPQGMWRDWLEEGGLPGQMVESDDDYHFFGGGPAPRIVPGERVYIVAHGRLRGYAPLTRLERLAQFAQRPGWWWGQSSWALVRQGGAVAVTIPEAIRGFQGWRERWWDRAVEVPFPAFATADVREAR